MCNCVCVCVIVCVCDDPIYIVRSRHFNSFSHVTTELTPSTVKAKHES
eukprot:COSAG03_NODE_529_length_7125_cov_25.402220_9_plen_48_part_00